MRRTEASKGEKRLGRGWAASHGAVKNRIVLIVVTTVVIHPDLSNFPPKLQLSSGKMNSCFVRLSFPFDFARTRVGAERTNTSDVFSVIAAPLTMPIMPLL